MLLLLFGTIALNVWLYMIVPKGFFPQQDTGQMIGGIQTDQASAFPLTSQKFRRFVGIVQRDPAVATVTGFVGGGPGGFMFVGLKPRAERKVSTDEVIARLRPKLMTVPGAQAFLQAVQDVRVGGRQSSAQYQYTLQSDDLDLLRTWADKLAEELKKHPDEITDVNSDQQEHGLETFITVNRDTAARLGLTSAQVDNALYDAFGQRQVSTIYNPLNQYHVVMEADPQFATSPEVLNQLYVTSGQAATAGPPTASSHLSQAISPITSLARVPNSRAVVTPAQSLYRIGPTRAAIPSALQATRPNAVGSGGGGGAARTLSVSGSSGVTISTFSGSGRASAGRRGATTSAGGSGATGADAGPAGASANGAASGSSSGSGSAGAGSGSGSNAVASSPSAASSGVLGGAALSGAGVQRTTTGAAAPARPRRVRRWPRRRSA